MQIPTHDLVLTIYRAAVLLYSLVGQTVKRLPAMRETRVRFLGWEDPWRRKWQSIPAPLPGKSHGPRSLIGYSPWGRKELDTTEGLHFHFHIPGTFLVHSTGMISFNPHNNPSRHRLLFDPQLIGEETEARSGG